MLIHIGNDSGLVREIICYKSALTVLRAILSFFVMPPNIITFGGILRLIGQTVLPLFALRRHTHLQASQTNQLSSMKTVLDQTLRLCAVANVYRFIIWSSVRGKVVIGGKNSQSSNQRVSLSCAKRPETMTYLSRKLFL
jgi:hypothetical protein